MRRPAAKRWHGPSKPRQSLSADELDHWFERVDAIRQNRAKKPVRPNWLEMTTSELMREFA